MGAAGLSAEVGYTLPPGRPSAPTPGGPSRALLRLPQLCRQRVQAGRSVLCLFLYLCSGHLGLPTQCAGCARNLLPCWPAVCLVASTSCGHKPCSECLLRFLPGAARPSCAHKHRRPTCGRGSWLGTGVEATTRSGCSSAGGRTRPAVKQGVVATSKLATQEVSAWFGAMAQVRKAWDSRVPGPGPKKR